MSQKIIKLTEEDVIKHLKMYIDECDADELSRLCGDCFGGECYQNFEDPLMYDFIPNEYYTGEFNQ